MQERVEGASCTLALHPCRDYEVLKKETTRTVCFKNYVLNLTTAKTPVELLFDRVPNIDPENFKNLRVFNIEKLKLK